MALNIEEIKAKVLDLAIRGKLVDSSKFAGETGHELIEKINAERVRLIKEKKIKNPKKFELITDDETPYDVPENWSWVRVGDICHVINYGYTAKATSEDTGTKMLRITDIQDGAVNWESVPYCEIERKKLLSYVLNKNDIVIARTGGTVGKSFIIKEINTQAVYASYLIRLLPSSLIYADYLYMYLQSPTYWIQLTEGARGSGQPNVNATTLGQLTVPMPPLAEQNAIVEKVEELFETIDNLSSESKSQLATLDQLRQKMLDLAIRGKLVKQNEKDEPALELLKRIEEERGRLVKEGKIKKSKKLDPISDEEIPFEIPESWEWIRLGEVTTYGANETLKPNEVKGDAWVLELEDIDKDSGKLNKVIINHERKTKSNKNKFFAGDVLYGKLRPYLRKILVAPDNGVCSTEIIAFRGYCNISPQYIVNYLKSDYTNDYVNEITHGMNMPRLGTDNGRSLLFPLPPLKEQKRIVHKVEMVMNLIDKMEIEIQRKIDIIQQIEITM